MTPTGSVDEQRAAVRVPLDGGDGGCGGDGDPLGRNRGMERAEQVRPMDAEARQAGGDIVVADIENAPAAGMGEAVETVDPGAGAPDSGAEAKPVEDGETERLEEEARADRTRRLEPFEQIDTMAGARQEQRRRHAGDAATDDRDGVGTATG